MKRIAVFFPGIGYHCDKPLMYYSRALAREAGYHEILNVGYAYQKAGLRGNAEKMRDAVLDLYAQAGEALRDVRWTDYGDILFVSKSIGTAVAARYAAANGLICRNVFYTPVAQLFETPPHRGIAFTGTRDPWVDPAGIREGCARAGLPLEVIEGADHSLETGNALADLENLQRVMKKTRAYLFGESVVEPTGRFC